MQGYGNYGNPNGIGGMPGNRGFAVPNGINGTGSVVNAGNVGGVGINPGTYNWGYPANSYNQVPMQQDGRRYVTGRAGADAYQMQPGESEVILWDDDARRFYIKGYDEKGRPRVLEDNDYSPHVDPETPQNSLDMSNYATKDDIKAIMADTLKKVKPPNMNGYVTLEEFNKALSELSVGSGGKVVRSGESDA